MKFSSKEVIDAPPEAVFAALSDFDAHERLGARRGVQARRKDTLAAPGQGTQWDLEFKYRGKDHRMTAELVAWSPPDAMSAVLISRSVHALVLVELTPLSRARTRVRVDLEVEPKNLAARLFVQSLRLARARVNERYDNRVRTFLKDIEVRLGSA